MPLLKNVNDKNWQYANNEGDFEDDGSVYKQQEDWSNKEVKPGKSDHAFTIFAYSSCMLLPFTNDSTFDNSHPNETDLISGWVPANGSGVEKDRSFTVIGSGFRQLSYD